MNSAPFRFSVEEVRTWASQLAAESRVPSYFSQYYVCPREILQVERLLEDTRAAVVGIVGVQGVGKTSALQALHSRYLKDTGGRKDFALLKWRRRTTLFESLLNETHELSDEFREQYAWYLLEELRLRLPQVPDLPQSAVGLNIEQAEKALGKSVWLKVRTEAWLHVLVRLSVVLIDMPDYSKSDRRLMTSDLNEIYWLWNRLAADSHPPNLVIAVQKEMFGGHFFDKMHKIELKPLNPEQMVEAYERRFGTLNPFTAEVLATLARMSRGVFRRYLRYISMAIEHWEGQPTHNESIEASLVKEAIPIERLAEDMELELSELFPKQGDLRYQSVQLLLHLQAHGPQGQTQLAQTLDIQEYQLTRLLQKLERNRYIKREKRGKDKLVKLIDEAT